MKLKSQNGYVIELTIVFMLVTFAFCLVVTTFYTSLVAKRKYANQEIERQTTLNQIGEYYLRCVEAGKTFPTLNESNFNEYDWISGDTDATAFFNSCKNKYTFETGYSVKRGGFLEFYQKKAVSYKLKVKSGNTVQMVVIVVETKDANDNNKANYDIVDWSITDIHEGITYETEEDLSLLKRLWMWLGNLVQQWQANNG